MGLPGWKRVDVSPPPIDTDILVYPSWRAGDDMDVGHCWRSSEGILRWSIAGSSGGSIGKNVTHWQELPKAP